MNVKIYDFRSQEYDVGVSIDNVSEISVTVISGDEILDIRTKDGKVTIYDSDNYSDSKRTMSFFNGSYVVPNEQLEEWADRKNSYDWILSGEHEVYGSF